MKWHCPTHPRYAGGCEACYRAKQAARQDFEARRAAGLVTPRPRLTPEERVQRQMDRSYQQRTTGRAPIEIACCGQMQALDLAQHPYRTPCCGKAVFVEVGS